MQILSEITRTHAEAVVWLSGFVFALLGATLLLQPGDRRTHRLSRILWLAGAFAALHGVADWLSLWSRIHPTGPQTARIGGLILGVSFLLLFEFGHRLTAGSMADRGDVFRAIVRRGYVLSAALVGLVLLFRDSPATDLAILSRYVLGFGGSMLAAIGFARHADRAERRHGTLPFRLAAAAFAGYGLLVVIAPSSALAFPSFANEALFLATFGLPVAVFRMACAGLALVAVTRILAGFQIQTQDRLREALRETERSLGEVRRLGERNELILESAGRGIFGIDREGRTMFVNSQASDLLGWTVQELIGRPAHEVFHALHPDCPGPDGQVCPIGWSLEHGEVRHVEDDVFRLRDGSLLPVEYTSTPVSEGDSIVGCVVSFRDVTERKKAQEHLRLAALVIENTPEGVLITDGDGKIQSANPAFLATTGYRREELIGETPRILRSDHHPPDFHEHLRARLREQGFWQGEIWNRRCNGEVYPEWLSINALRDEQGAITNFVGIYSDVNMHQAVQQRLHRLAYYDDLTGLPNRQLFTDRLGLALAHARRESQIVGLMFLDLDRFKNINDSLGHSVGDALLEVVAARLRGTVREGDTVARIGGDEFTVILPGLNDPRDGGRVARKILEAFSRPFVVDEREFYITASIGISVFPHDGEDLESLTRKADIAMYRAKEIGRNNYQFYLPDMSERFRRRLALENHLRSAFERDELYLDYQPQVDVRRGCVIGVEALARWKHPEWGELPPSQFIPVAEESGQIDRLGEWVLRTACREASRWIRARGGDFQVAVNLSVQQLRRKGLVEFVAEVLDENGIDPRRLTLELTESVLMDHSASAVATLTGLGNLGVQIAIDDFGTGYSSLGYIKRLSIDRLKIDQSFVRDIPEDSNDRALAAMIIAMAHASNMRVVAEGVERREQLDFLRNEGCDEMQGFLFSRPVPAIAIDRMLSGRDSGMPELTACLEAQRRKVTLPPLHREQLT